MTSLFGVKESSEPIQEFQGINRRKNTRVGFPVGCNYDFWPSINFNGQNSPIVDLSLGGAQVRDPNKVFPAMGESEFSVELTIEGQVFEEACIIVHSRDEVVHLRFVSLDAEAYVKLSLFLKPGYLGGQFRQLDHGDSSAGEVWVNSANDKLELYENDPAKLAVCNFMRTNILVMVSGSVKVQDGDSTYDISDELKASLILCLHNFNYQSPSVERLLSTLK